MLESLSNKVVWITGASSGIGEYLAYQLAELGCCLVLSARRMEELERVKETCIGTLTRYCLNSNIKYTSRSSINKNLC